MKSKNKTLIFQQALISDIGTTNMQPPPLPPQKNNKKKQQQQQPQMKTKQKQ